MCTSFCRLHFLRECLCRIKGRLWFCSTSGCFISFNNPYQSYRQEFDTREAAEESVAKYNEGHFMGNKIKVELSHGGGRAAKFNAEPGACFRCGQQGHWARCVEQMYLSILYITAHYSRECPSGHGM